MPTDPVNNQTQSVDAPDQSTDQQPSDLSADRNVSGKTIAISIILTIVVPILFFIFWRYLKYAFPAGIGIFFFLMINRLNLQKGRGVTIGALLFGLIVPVTGIPYVVDGIYELSFKAHKFGPVPVELAFYALPFVVGIAYILRGHKLLDRSSS